MRPLAAADAPRLSELSSDFDIARMTTRIAYPNSVENVRVWLLAAAAESEQVFIVTRAGEVIGVCGCNQRSDPPGEIGYWLGRPYWGQGFATEMVRA